jgi:integrase
MSFAQLQIGTEIALPLQNGSYFDVNQALPVRTTGDLLNILTQKPPRSFAMMRTACGWLGRYLDLPGDQIPFDLIEDRKSGFRPFLEGRRLSESSIRSYVYQQRSLLKAAMRNGWRPDDNATAAWKSLLKVAAEKHLTDITRYLSRSTKSPAEVTKEAVDRWGEARISDGLMFTTVATKKNHFWRLLENTGWISGTPAHLLKFTYYGIPIEQMPEKLREEIETVLKWKQAAFARNRPKKGKIRAVSANNVRLILQQLTSYVVKICRGNPRNLCELIEQDNVAGFIEWMINERRVRGNSIQGRLASVLAIVRHHPMFAGQDFTWFKNLIDSIPLEDASERKKRKATKYVSYEELEAIPAQIRAHRAAYEKKRKKNDIKVAELAMQELIFRWYLVFPWRSRNLRECRIFGTAPNLFKARIPPISAIDKPKWIEEEEAKNPAVEFWQISFEPNSTKTHIPVDLFVTRNLVGPLEEYLAVYRPLLVQRNDPGTLFVTPRGKPMRSDQVGKVIGHWTTKFASKRTTPHMIRDSVAYKWLKEHSKDYLTLSKILWHKNVQTTIQIYGSRFNESSGTCAMEAWLDQREAEAKPQ